jgi:release factor glutamine methyltransferase
MLCAGIAGKPMRVIDCLRNAAGELAEAGIAGGELDVQLLLGHCLKKSRTELYLAAESEIPAQALEDFTAMVKRRKKYEPVAYILGEREFWSLPFAVSPAVLIPRPETEFLLEQVLAAVGIRRLPEGQFVDLCCGSGVIAIVLALELQREIVAVDLSGEALEVARQNCLRYRVDETVSLIRSDLLAAFAGQRRISLLVSNPPYVSRYEISEELDPEVVAYEPLLALDGGEDGLDVIRRIKLELPEVMLPGGEIFIEIGAGQGGELLSMFAQEDGTQNVFEHVEVLKDYAGRDRVLHVRMAREIW